jgi:hypothetical protein
MKTIFCTTLICEPSYSTMIWSTDRVPRFVDRDHFMRQRGGGVGHLSTRHCNKVLLHDKLKLLHDNVDALSHPHSTSTSPEQPQSNSHDKDSDSSSLRSSDTPENMDGELAEIEDADEEDLVDDEGAVDALEGAIDDEDILAAAGFSAL